MRIFNHSGDLREIVRRVCKPIFLALCIVSFGVVKATAQGFGEGEAPLDRTRSMLVLEKIDRCNLVAAPSVIAANVKSDQVPFDTGRLYALYRTVAIAALSVGELAYQREYNCRNLRAALVRNLRMAVLFDDGKYYEVFLYEKHRGAKPVDASGSYTIPESDTVYNPGTLVIGVAETKKPAPATDAHHGLEALTSHDATRVRPIARLGLPAWALLSYADAVISREPQLQTCIDNVYLSNRGKDRVDYTGCLDDLSGQRLLDVLAQADTAFEAASRGEIAGGAETPLEPENVEMARWEGFIDACIPIAIDQYARPTEDAMFECTCYAAAADLAVNDAYLTYQYGAQFNVELEDLPKEQSARYSSLRLTCTDRSMRTSPEFESVVTALTAPRIAAFLEPTEDLTVGEFMGLTAHENGNGPLKIISISAGSPMSHLRVGDIVTRVEWNEVRNLSQFRAAIEAAKAQGASSVRLSMRRGQGFFRQELNF